MATRRTVQAYLLVAGGVLLLLFVSVFVAMAVRQERLIRNELSSSAEALFEHIVLARRWSAEYGGVYVLKAPGVQSNPYLRNPDIRSVDGKTYTLKNPALMTREISTQAGKSSSSTSPACGC